MKSKLGSIMMISRLPLSLIILRYRHAPVYHRRFPWLALPHDTFAAPNEAVARMFYLSDQEFLNDRL